MAFHLQNQDLAFINSRPTGWPYENVEDAPALHPGDGPWQLRMTRQGVIVLWEKGKPFPRKFGRGTVVASTDDRKKLERAMIAYCQSLRGYFPEGFISTPYDDWVMGFNWTTGTPVQYGLAYQVFAALLTGTETGRRLGYDLGDEFMRRANEDLNQFWAERKPIRKA